jgi:hypothetical protein
MVAVRRFGEPSPSSRATVKRDNYADLRIKNFPQEYPQFSASVGMLRYSQQEY